MILENYLKVVAQKDEICQQCGRNPSEVKLLPVSKFQETPKIEALLAAGIAEFGENYVQELCDKAQALPDARFHMIGHLQRNKVKALLKAHPTCIESVDSERLALTIQKEAAEMNISQEILLQVNAGSEENKTGLSFEEILLLAETISQMPNLLLKGLMVVAPQVETPEEVRPYFHRAKEVFDELNVLYSTVDTLSMGMTHDFQIAIEEGSTEIRVGTAIFGARHL